jgi:hypothetical protein
MTDTGPRDGRVRWVRQQLGTQRASFREWRRRRPFAGGLCLVGAGLVIGYIPVQFAGALFLLGNAFTMLGVIFAVLVVSCGVMAIKSPEYAELVGTAGVVFSILSIFGALGGFGIGLVLGVVGGNLVASWTPPETDGADERPVNGHPTGNPARQ